MIKGAVPPPGPIACIAVIVGLKMQGYVKHEMVRDLLGEEIRKFIRAHAASCFLCFMSMSHRWAQARRLDLASHLRSIAGTIVEQEEAEKIFLANALGKNGVLNAWAMPQVIRQTVSRVCRMSCRIS
jgi:hypothetical protein